MNKTTQPQAGKTKPTATSSEEVWDEARLEEAAKSLDEMYKEVRALRSTIPKLLSPLAARHPSPQDFYKAFADSIIDTHETIEKSRKLLMSPSKEEILEYATKSEEKNRENILPWRITDHPDWLSKQD